MFPGHTSCQYERRNVERVLYKGRNYNSLQQWVRNQIDASVSLNDHEIRFILSDPKIWGDPETFRPERFLGPDADDLPNPLVITFGYGTRYVSVEASLHSHIYGHMCPM
jgi:hypothetical protein